MVYLVADVMQCCVDLLNWQTPVSDSDCGSCPICTRVLGKETDEVCTHTYYTNRTHAGIVTVTTMHYYL